MAKVYNYNTGKEKNIYLIFPLAWFAFVLFVLGSWVANIVKLVGAITSNSEIGALFIGRIIGIPFIPLGAILGWF